MQTCSDGRRTVHCPINHQGPKPDRPESADCRAQPVHSMVTVCVCPRPISCLFGASLLRLELSLKSFCMNHQHLPCVTVREALKIYKKVLTLCDILSCYIILHYIKTVLCYIVFFLDSSILSYNSVCCTLSSCNHGHAGLSFAAALASSSGPNRRVNIDPV